MSNIFAGGPMVYRWFYSLILLITLSSPNLWAQTPPEVIVGPLSGTSATPGDSGPITFDVSFSGASSAEISVADVLVSPTATAAATVTTTTPFGSAMNFGPRASRLADALLDIDVTAGITLEAWVKPSDLTINSGPGAIMNYDDFGPGFGYGLHLEPGDNASVMNLVCRLGPAFFATTTSPVQVGQWQHAACTFDGSTVRLFVNSVEQQSFADSPPVNYGGFEPLLTVGEDINFTPFSGSIDELRIWSSTRSQAELAAGMAAPLSGAPPGPTGYWQFDAFEDLATGPNAGSNDIRDLSGNNLHLDTEIGAALGTSTALYGATVSLSNFAGDGSLDLSLAAGIAVDAAGTPSALKVVTETISVAMTASAPEVVSITPDVTSPTNADNVTFRVVFNEDVTGFATEDLVITRPGVTLVSTGITEIDGSNYDVLISGIDGNGTLTIGVRASAVQNGALLFNTTEVSSDALVIDNTGPNPALSSLATSPLDGSPILVDIDFDEDVFDFAITDLTATNATLSALTGSAASYSVTVTPTTYGQITIKMAAFGAVVDEAGNPSAQGNTLEWTYPEPDTGAPFLTSTNGPSIATTDAFAIDITFSEPVVGFEQTDLAFSATGTAGYTGVTLTEQTSSAYRINISGATGQGELSIQIAAGSLTDASGNPNALLTVVQPIDRVGPGVVSSNANPVTGASIGESITFQIQADETVKSYNTNLITVITTGDAGFLWNAVGEITVNSSVVNITFDGANIGGGDGTMALQLNPGALTDNAGNPSTMSHTTPAVTIDKTLPQLLSLQPVVSERQFSPGVVVFEGVLSEPAVIGGGFTVDYEFLAVSNPEYPADLNTLVRVGLPDFITPERFHIEVDIARVPYGADFKLWLVAQLSLQDTAGNDQTIGPRRSESPAIIDLLTGGVTLSTPRDLTNASPITVNAQFTSAINPGFPAAVTGFGLDDLNLTNATASNLSGSGADYSFDLTPIADGQVSVWVSADAARDADDRPNRNSEILSIEYDVTGPTILSVEAQPTSNPGNDPFFPVFIEVSEPLDRASLESAVGANLVTTGSLISGIQRSEAVVPGFEVVEILNSPDGEGTVTFAVPAGAVTDLAGNPSTNSFALPAPVSVDRIAPTVSVSNSFVAGTNPIDVTSDSISATEVTFVFMFSEPVLDVQESDFTVDRDGPLGYTGTSLLVTSPTEASFTVSGIASDGVLTATLAEGGVTDQVGNGNVAAASSVNINNLATEVVSITPESPVINADSTSFIVEWSKPVDGFDSSRFRLTDSSVTSTGSITIAAIDTLRSQVTVPGLSGTGEFALEILDGAARDRFNNPNFASFTSPPVTRTGVQMYGAFSVLTNGESSEDEATGNPDLFINEVFALRGDDTTPARLTWDGRFLTLFGRLELLTSPVVQMNEFGSVTTPIIMDSVTGEIQNAGGDFPIGGGIGKISACSLQLVLDNRALRLSGSMPFYGEGLFSNAIIDPRNPSNRVVLDALSTFSVTSPGAPCEPSDLTFQALNFTETTRGFAFNVNRASSDASSPLGLITGRVEYDGAEFLSPRLSEFELQFSGFNWRVVPDDSNPGQDSVELLPGTLRFAGLRHDQAGLIHETDAMEILSGLSITLPSTLVVSLPCIRVLVCPNGRSRSIVTMNEPAFELDRITSANSTYVNRYIMPGTSGEITTTTSTTTRAEIIGSASRIYLYESHALTIGEGTRLDVPSAYIDNEAYWAVSAKISTEIGDFEYSNIALSHYLNPTLATTTATPATGQSDFGDLEIAALNMPLTWPQSPIAWRLVLKLPTFLTSYDLVTTRGNLEGNVTNIEINALSSKWCTYDLFTSYIDGLDIQVQPFCLSYSTPPPIWVGSINVGLPVGPYLGGEVTIVAGQFDGLRINAPMPFPVPLGNSGVFLTAINASLANLSGVQETCTQRLEYDPSNEDVPFRWITTCTVDPVEFRGKADFVYGPVYVLPESLPAIGGSPQNFLGAAVETWITDERIKAKGEFYVFSPSFLNLGEVTGILTFSGPKFEGSARKAIQMVPGMVGTAKIAAGDLYVNGELIASIEVPKTVPIIGGYTFASVGLGVDSRTPSILGSFYAFGASFNVGIDFGSGELYFPDEANTVERAGTLKPDKGLKSWESSTVYQVDEKGYLKQSSEPGKSAFEVLANYPKKMKRYMSATTQALETTITIESSSPTLVRLAWANKGEMADFTLVGPDSTLFSPTTVETNINVPAPVGLLQGAGAGDATYVFNQPTPGVYTVYIANADDLGETALEVRVQNAEPNFEFVNIVTTGDELFLDWNAEDTDNDAQIRFYIDSDRAGLNGQLLAGPFSEDSQSTTTVDLAAVSAAPGNYWIYAQVDDGVNAPTVVYANEPLFFINPDAPPAIRNIDVVAAADTAIVSWEPSPDPDIIGYAVRWTTDIEGSFFEDSISVEKGLSSAVVTGLTPNTTYKFTVVSRKEGTGITARRAALQDMHNAAQGKAVGDPDRIEYLGDQITRLSASISHGKPKPSKNLDAYRLNRVQTLAVPLADSVPEVDSDPAMAESLIVEFDIVKTTSLIGQNNVPQFISQPTLTVLPSELYQYAVEVLDQDGDAVSLNLVEGPPGMTLDTENVLSWAPDGVQGVFEVTLEASDGDATVPQDWFLTSAGGFADVLRLSNPGISSAPPGELFTLTAETLGGCDSPISYQLLTAPEGMTISASGLIQWAIPASSEGEDIQLVVAASQVCAGGTIQTSRTYFFDVEADGGDVAQIIEVQPSCADGPTATLSGPLLDTGSDELANLRVDLTGTAPWLILWVDGESQQNIQTSPVYRTVPRDGQAYALAEVSDARCSGTAEGMVVAKPPQEAIAVPLLRKETLALFALLLFACAMPALRRRTVRVR